MRTCLAAKPAVLESGTDLYKIEAPVLPHAGMRCSNRE